MRSIGFGRWCINTTINVMDIIQRPDFYLKYNVSENGFCLQVAPTQLGAIDRVSPCLQAQYHLRTETDSCIRKVLYKSHGNVQNCYNYVLEVGCQILARTERFRSIEKSNDFTGNRANDRPDCSIVSNPIIRNNKRNTNMAVVKSHQFL
jgi:hypothetical protein